MKRRPAKQLLKGAFDIVRTVGLALPDVEATTKYDGSPVLKVDGMFMAGLATHPSAEPDTLKGSWRMRPRFTTYRSYPLVLVRLLRVEPDALHDLMSVSWRMTTAKARRRRSDESNKN